MKPFSQFLLTSEKVFALICRIQVTLPVTLFQDTSAFDKNLFVYGGMTQDQLHHIMLAPGPPPSPKKGLRILTFITCIAFAAITGCRLSFELSHKAIGKMFNICHFSTFATFVLLPYLQLLSVLPVLPISQFCQFSSFASFVSFATFGGFATFGTFGGCRL